jgi:Family of unknown function (DUF6152)
MAYKSVLWSSIVALAMFSDTAVSHHSFATAFDVTRTIQVRGQVVDFRLRSPHSTIVLDGRIFVDGEPISEQSERWEFESGSVPGMRRLGIDANTFRPGDSITVTAWPNRNPDFRFAFGTEYLMADGTTIAVTSDPLAAADVSSVDQSVNDSVIDRVIGRWRSPGYLPGDESPLPLNADGRAAWKNYDPKKSPANTCEPQSIPGTFSAPYLFDVRVDGESIVLHNEPYDIVRTIRLNSEPAPAYVGDRYANDQFGYASARIENDRLVIESDRYPASGWGLGIATHLNGGGADVPSSPQKSVIERFSVSPDGRTLYLDYRLTDPVYLTEPYEGRFELYRVSDDTAMYPYECNVEAASQFSRDAYE